MFDLVTFDCYGTLIDWEDGIWSAFRSRAPIPESRRQELLDTYHAVEAKIELESYRPYSEVLRNAAIAAGGALGIDTGDGSFLSDSLPRWPPFPETNAALERLRSAGMQLAILSNVDEELLARTRQHFTVDFEFVVTAEQVKSYKPAPGHFEEAAKKTSGRRWLHAAQSYYHDIVPAVRLGTASAWINRKRETPDGSERADYVVPDLMELANALGV